MKIRKAKKEDSKEITTYLLLAMEDIFYLFIGERNYEKAFQTLETLVTQEGNQYSYENCWVVENEEGIVATTVIYDGAKLSELRLPVAKLIESQFGRAFNPEDETQVGEFYIDCIGVNPNQQGKGLGSKLITFLIKEYVEKRKATIGLLVEKENPNAKRLYLKLGFEVIGEKTITGKKLEHLQLRTIKKIHK